MSHPPYDTPIGATAEQGLVLLDGPGGLALSMTPAAADASAKALARAAEEAEAQTSGEVSDGGSGRSVGA
ncbi:hypothetical protein [Sphingomonas endolithica]|uniref:hypothetical protein n=1 Tax=Sphingomonas endolithica TaxID=2972485 RepID=UPI0021AFB4B2|nr:hypothetical protein [Sphingomonas sp. ZFBP2030]